MLATSPTTNLDAAGRFIDRIAKYAPDPETLFWVVVALIALGIVAWAVRGVAGSRRQQ